MLVGLENLETRTAGDIARRHHRLAFRLERRRQLIAFMQRRRTSFRLRTISVTSSLTPGIVENSCSTPLIRTAVIAKPGSEESEDPAQGIADRVPYPRSSGSAKKRP